MEELVKKFAEYLGDPYVASVGYASLAYGLFHWLDENASDEAKAALARTMRFKDYKNEQVASALVEVFDRIYTYPLLSWRAFFRSFLFTTVVFAIYLFEFVSLPPVSRYLVAVEFFNLLFNVFSDYLSLFVIRPLLTRSGTKPVVGLALGTVSGAAIVLGANTLRTLFIPLYQLHFDFSHWAFMLRLFFHSLFSFALEYAWPAMAVFVWLPLFALGILIVRLLTPLTWIVGRTQWFLKEGKEHPLKAIGYVAAVVVFVGTVAGRAVFGA
ncbi:hypothetical protein AAE026_10075 [Bradyrhizobium sp. DN5]|uniref:hypothetical protein n=1 Tax=Bradyrhizobium sp. DN5 TaxID=3056950 RepID=UPI003523EA9E